MHQKPPLKPRPNFALEQELRKTHKKIIGIDEVGRGAIAGPLVVAAVELTQPIDGITDSKLLSAKKREELFIQIVRKCSQLKLAVIHSNYIDSDGISTALKKAYANCLGALEFDLVLSDNVALEYKHIRSIKGDSLFYSIAAASIVAKVYRDQLMRSYAQFYPHFQWHKNAGYGTAAHFEALKISGKSPLHRQSFLTRTH